MIIKFKNLSHKIIGSVLIIFASIPTVAADSEYMKYLKNSTDKMLREQDMRDEVSKTCRPPPDYSPVKDVWKCEIAIYQKYGATDEVARAQRSMAEAEERQRQEQMRKEAYAKEELTKAAERRRKDEAREAERIENRKQEQVRCEQTPSIRIGMTPNQVIASKWGYSSDRHTTTTATYQREQWIYASGPKCGGRVGQTYLYFEGGVLTAIQE